MPICLHLKIRRSERTVLDLGGFLSKTMINLIDYKVLPRDARQVRSFADPATRKASRTGAVRDNLVHTLAGTIESVSPLEMKPSGAAFFKSSLFERECDALIRTNPRRWAQRFRWNGSRKA
ncbi:MAG TPA: hypothetical protein DCY03_25630 [Planctomycetaceae bacterium]|nr:hypothetical protein [Planctomycetaceae bacterium]